MPFEFIQIPANGQGSAKEELNRLLRGGRIASVRKEFVPNGEDSFWAFCIFPEQRDQLPRGEPQQQQPDEPQQQHRVPHSPQLRPNAPDGAMSMGLNRPPSRSHPVIGCDKMTECPPGAGRAAGGGLEGSGRVRRSFQRIILTTVFLALSTFTLPAAVTAMILAGDEFATPEDRPSLRLDPETTQSSYAMVGALEMVSGGRTYLGSGVAIAPGWVLSAGHNVDFNDDGVPDSGVVSNFHLPGFGAIAVTERFTAPAFTGFGNPSIHHDLSLLRLATPLPSSMVYPGIGGTVTTGNVLTLVGFGRSGYGSYGYTTSAGLVDRRIGFNTLESIQTEPGGSGQLFRYTFHAPDDPASLGNDLETLIGPGDSGGPAFIETADGLVLVGIHTFTEGFGGRFGDTGGGVLLDQANLHWIQSTTGIPEPSVILMLFAAVVFLFLLRQAPPR